jgi:NAD(P)-dependent dehydrogenase (short-subunit alcohol dehydrogenase family)
MVKLRLKGKSALITGAGSGMGRETALEFLRQGASVLIADIDREALENTVAAGREISSRIVGVQANLVLEADCKRAVDTAVESFGTLNVLFNNLGINLSATVADTTEAEWDKVFAVNVRSMFLTCKYALPVMMKDGGGAIINTSSGGGAAALKGLAAYSASKGAVISLTRSVAVDYAAYNIRANYLIPGVIMTDMTRKVIEAQPDPQAYEENMRTNNPLQRFGTEHEIAMAAVYLASDETAFMTGAGLVVDGGYLAQ